MESALNLSQKLQPSLVHDPARQDRGKVLASLRRLRTSMVFLIIRPDALLLFCLGLSEVLCRSNTTGRLPPPRIADDPSGPIDTRSLE